VTYLEPIGGSTKRYVSAVREIFVTKPSTLHFNISVEEAVIMRPIKHIAYLALDRFTSGAVLEALNHRK
jgi:hypothetical protein